MKRRTAILADLIQAAQHLDATQEALTRAYVELRERHGDEAQAALETVTSAREAAYDPLLADLLEVAITAVGRMP